MSIWSLWPFLYSGLGFLPRGRCQNPLLYVFISLTPTPESLQVAPAYQNPQAQ